jgi:hypothetical protein
MRMFGECTSRAVPYLFPVGTMFRSVLVGMFYYYSIVPFFVVLPPILYFKTFLRLSERRGSRERQTPTPPVAYAQL